MFFMLGILASSNLYAIIFLFVCIGRGIDMAAVLPLLLLTYFSYRLVIHPIMFRISVKFRGLSYDESYFSSLLGCVGADITNPFRGLIALFGMSKIIDSTGFRRSLSWGGQILHFIWAIALFGFFIIAFVFVL